ncbi:L-serine ammonia-lyase, iron-sulfur-dependent, subunit alpha [Novipirellula artificiosorum]|uniref:L-serine ammonia-lyase n=1 Tax=Novipirellula artificiosorum TaxID=2528016 RepID=A0A5C6DJ31_9BACT|nr:L-serine ammonia-lyase, iron-sulfur-dependent, subunit alpha [Novipirellula artificiosorum]TWU35907.1 L-serine dehydratase, alpha chain [Novipirellula artificiosorum]
MPSTLPASIFNDVLGPIMRGPSSSHSAASVRIARLARDLAGGHVDHALIEFDPNGSLATTHASQGSDLGLFAGLLGWEADDPRLPEGHKALVEQGVEVEIVVRAIGATHPNTYRLTVTNRELGATHVLEADSLGGGMIVVHRIDALDVELFGDQIAHVFGGADGALRVQIGKGVALERQGNELWERRLNRVLPVPTPSGLRLPFSSVAAMTAQADPTQRPLSAWALEYECARGGLDESEVLSQMSKIRDVMRGSIDAGLNGTDWGDRILGNQSAGFRSAWDQGQLLDGGMLNRMVLYVTALMEAKSAMEVIVAAPTAGSCGLFAGTCLAAADALSLDDGPTLRSMLSGGLIGVFVALRSSFAAEVGGCQAETGAGSAMAAATLVEMMGGNAAQSLSAASLALQNVLGLVCDPVANRVEAPCLGRNVSGASNALVSANMALAGYDALIPFDEVLDAHRQISQSMPRELRCTALGGLSITPTSKALEQRLCGGCDS